MLEKHETPVTPSILNTSFFLQESTPGIEDYFHKIKPLETYGLVQWSPTPATPLRTLVVDKNWRWFEKLKSQYFEKEPKRLSLKQVKDFINFVRESEFESKLKPKSMYWNKRDLHKHESDEVVYLDDLIYDSKNADMILSIVAQIMLETFTNRMSRLTYYKVKSFTKVEYKWGVLVKSTKAASALLLDPTESIYALQGHWLTTLRESIGDDVQSLDIEILHNQLQVMPPTCRYEEKKKRFSIFACDGQEIHFHVLGRSPAERRFKKEAERIKKSKPEELVPIEIGFHPFWFRLGHTTLRIGDCLYEFTRHGWKAHKQGPDSARAFLFNNPFMKKQYDKYAQFGMPPASVAATLMIKKETAIRLWITLENLVAAEGFRKERFSLYLNNCNHGVMRVLKSVGLPGFTDRGYKGFSSVLSFRQILLNSELPVQGYYVYPLPGADINEFSLRLWVPKFIYRRNTLWREVIRATPGWAIRWVYYQSVRWIVNPLKAALAPPTSTQTQT